MTSFEDLRRLVQSPESPLNQEADTAKEPLTPEQAAEIEKRLQQVLDELFAHPDLPKNEPDLTPVKST